MLDCDRVLGIVAKQPQPGKVKTRLAERTSPEWAAALAAALLRDAIERWADFPARRVLVFSPAEAAAYFESLAGGRFERTPQTDGDLGRRMEAFFAGELRRGGRRVVLIGTDSPTLPRDYLDRAFQSLESADVVFGPATDGGYYLLGCRDRLPPIFDDISWGEAGVLAASVARLEDSSWRLAVLPPWYDVDTIEDCQVLRGHLAALRRAGHDPQLPLTEPIIARRFPSPICS